MADFDPAVENVLQHEGGFAHVKETGEIVNFGITLKLLRSMGMDVDENYIRTMTRDMAKEYYREYFWDRPQIGRIDNQKLATAVMNFCVNMGIGTGIMLLQRALNECREIDKPKLAVDGRLGPKTLEYANTLPVHRGTLDKLVELAMERYRNIANDNAVLAMNLDAWLARAQSLL